LIGNKADKQKERQVTEDEGLEFAKKHKLDYIECSAFNALNIDLVFSAIVRKVVRERSKKEEGLMETPQGKESPAQRLKREKKDQNSTGGCC
jgi:GTPase SAR1 family protein